MGNLFTSACCDKSTKIVAIVVFPFISLFTLIVIMLFLRYLKRRFLQLIYELDGGIPGLHAKHIAELPTITYRKNRETEIMEECSICLAEFEDGDLVRALPNCVHLFHKECIDKWLARCGACPVCRSIVIPEYQEQEQEPPLRVIIELPPSLSTSAATSPMMSAVSTVYSSPMNVIINNDATMSGVHSDEFDDVIYMV